MPVDYPRDGEAAHALARQYDSSGNLLKQIDRSGAVTLNEYYPAQGGDGCPADPEGKVRHLRCSTLIPAPGYASAPTLKRRYRYALADDGGVELQSAFLYDPLQPQFMLAFDPSVPSTPHEQRAAECGRGIDYDPIARRLVQTLDSGGRVITMENALGKPASVERFDRQGELVGRTLFYYDGHGRCVKRQDALGRVTTYAYDVAGRLTLNTLPDGTRIQTQYCARTTHPQAQAIWVDGYRLKSTAPAHPRSLPQASAAERLKQVQGGSLVAQLRYDSSARLVRGITHNGTRQLITERIHDDFGRPVLCTWTAPDAQPLQLKQAFGPMDKLMRRTLSSAQRLLRDERFEYDARGRLQHYTCDGELLPLNDNGLGIKAQTFSFDALDNIRDVRTVFADGHDIVRFFYDNPDKTQLTRLERSYCGEPPRVSTFQYDAQGCQRIDDRGRHLDYDARGRLIRVTEVAV